MSGVALVIVNREPTDLDDLADLVINAEIGPGSKKREQASQSDCGPQITTNPLRGIRPLTR